MNLLSLLKFFLMCCVNQAYVEDYFQVARGVLDHVRLEVGELRVVGLHVVGRRESLDGHLVHVLEVILEEFSIQSRRSNDQLLVSAVLFDVVAEDGQDQQALLLELVGLVQHERVEAVQEPFAVSDDLALALVLRETGLPPTCTLSGSLTDQARC